MLSSPSRLSFLDSLRGVAILFVLLAHAFARSELHDWFDIGRIGVQIFFVISGFVIFMSLEKYATFSQFLFKRWIRLFPAMLFVSLTVFLTAPLFADRPLGKPHLENLIPGLTFIDPMWWQCATGHYIRSVEMTFWTLFVEFKFYVFSAFFYYLGGPRIALGAVAAAFALAVLQLCLLPTDILGTTGYIISFTSFGWFGWFAFGAFLYRLMGDTTGSRSTWNMSGALALGVAAALFDGVGQGTIWRIAAYLGIVAVFTAAVMSPRIQAYLSRPWLLFLGFISYPLYLIHENMMVSMTQTLKRVLGDQFSVINYGVPIAIVIALGWCIAKYVEPWVRSLILKGLAKGRAKLSRIREQAESADPHAA